MLAWSPASAWTVPLETRAPPLTLTLTVGRDPHTFSLLTSPDSPLWTLGPEALSGGPAVGNEQVYCEPPAEPLGHRLSLAWSHLPGTSGGHSSNSGHRPGALPEHRPGAARCTHPAGHLPAQPLLGTALSPGRGAREGGFLGSRVPYITKDRSRCSLTDSVIQRMFLEHLLRAKETVRAKSLQSCPTFCDPMDWSPPGFVHGILQVRILEWVAVPSSRTSQPRD